MTLAIGGVALAVAVLVIGGALRWTQSSVAVLVAGALLSQLSSRRRLAQLSPIVLMLLIAIGLTALQLVPMPPSLLELFNSTGHDLRIDGAALADTMPQHCLSMDPAGTLRGLSFLITLLGVALLSLRFAASEHGRYLLLAGVAMVCGLAALVTGLHTLVNADSLYGVYAPLHAQPPILGPLLNPNHLGCLMALGTTISIGLAFYERQSSQWRVVWVVIFVGCAIVTFASLSRGAALSLVLGVVVTGAILFGRGLGDVSGRRRSNQLPIALVVGVGLALAVYSSAGNVADQLDKTSLVEVNHPTSKFAAWKSSVQLVAESPWIGVGRGAVESTFTRVHPASANFTFSHLENEYIQAIVEFGIPGALAMGLALAWCIILAIRRWRDGPLAAAALGAIAGVMFQSSVDFGVEILGLAIPVTIVASTLLIHPARETSRFAALWTQRGALIVALLLGAVALMLPATRSLQEDHDDLVAEDTPPSMDELHAAIERHPLDYFGFAEIADEMIKAKDSHAVHFLNHALTLHPTHPGLHRLAARLLAASGRKDQAAVEYELAMGGTATPHLLLTEILANLPAANDAAAAIPTDYFNMDLILHSLKEFMRTDVSERWLVRIVDLPNPDLGVVDQLYDLAMAGNDLDVALRTANIRMGLANTTTSRLMRARAEFARKNYPAVLAELADVETWRDQINEHADAWLVVCDTRIELRDWDAALLCIHHLDATGMVAFRHLDIQSREQNIRDLRSGEVHAKQIQDLERQMNLPIDIDIPIVTGTTGPKPPPSSTHTILNPIKNPLLPAPK